MVQKDERPTPNVQRPTSNEKQNAQYRILDALVKSQKTSFFVIPAKAGIQCFKELMTDLDPGFRRGDDFLRVHHIEWKQ